MDIINGILHVDHLFLMPVSLHCGMQCIALAGARKGALRLVSGTDA